MEQHKSQRRRIQFGTTSNHYIRYLFPSRPARITLLLVIPLYVVATVNHSTAQSKPSAIDMDCNCGAIFNNLVSKIEANYVGYHLAIRGKRTAEYQSYTEALTKRAQSTSPDQCIFVLQDFVKFFRDGHMFINESPKLDEDDITRLAAAAEQTGMREENIRSYLDAHSGHLDPIEGVWYAKEGYRIGIVRDDKTKRRDFVGVMLSNGVEQWAPGQVKAEFRKLNDGSYSVVFYSGKHYPLHPAVYLRGQEGGAAIRRGLLLHMPPITWGKAYPLNANEQNLLDPADPRAPTIRFIGESTIVVSVPSHSPEYAAVLNQLVGECRERILNAASLIIDIRGDEGGSSWTTSVLMPFLVTKAKRPDRATGKPVVLSSQDNIAYFEQMKSQGWVPAHLVERLKSNVGKLVPFSDSDTAGSDQEATADDTATMRPHNGAILMDGAVVSAGEAFVLSAMRNEKVTVFGEQSGGTIDYQNVTIVRLPVCPLLGINLGYPTLAASDKLPVGGLNLTGVLPDVHIGSDVRNPIDFIINYYARKRRSG